TRTSDAIALATRFNAPIFTYENILDKAGIYLKIKDEFSATKQDLDIEDLIEEPKTTKKSKYSKDTLKQLNEKLDKAVRDEDYELAAKIRDEINKRSSK
ncbi:MAG: bifunctional nuclease family protein, partial [Bacteroidetes bacterium]|nr:bifunctional nuclease family protein [Bacteroidota bacterium]